MAPSRYFNRIIDSSSYFCDTAFPPLRVLIRAALGSQILAKYYSTSLPCGERQ